MSAQRPPVKAVVIGGGSGAPVSIRTLLDMGCRTSSIVGMIDDGGSTGILRERGGVIPPGDVRKCILAMSADKNSAFARAFSHRFSYLDDHALGNLILIAFAEETGSFSEAIHICEYMLDARGHVFPSTLQDVKLTGVTADGRMLEGEHIIGDSDCHMHTVSLHPANAQPHPAALNKIRQADLIVLGPGSLFTSIIPNLLVPGVVESIAKARSREENPAHTVFVCSLADMQGETWGMNCYDYVEALMRHGMEGLLDYVLIHKDAGGDPGVTGFFPVIRDYSDSRFQTRGRRSGKVRRVEVSDALVEKVAALGPVPIVRDLVDRERPTWHDQRALARAFGEVLAQCRLPQR